MWYFIKEVIGIPMFIVGIVAIIGGLFLTCTVFHKKNEGKYTGFMGWFYKFVNYIEKILKYILIALKYIWKSIYLIGAIAITLTAFVKPITNIILGRYWSDNPVGCMFRDIFLILIVGNLVWRLICELAPIVVLFVPKLIRKFFRWVISVPHRPRPFIVQNGKDVEATPENVISWNYFKKNSVKPSSESEKNEQPKSEE